MRYPFDHEHLFTDFRVCVWLTNEPIVSHGIELTSNDLAFYKKSLVKHLADEQKNKARKRQREAVLRSSRRVRRLENQATLRELENELEGEESDGEMQSE